MGLQRKEPLGQTQEKPSSLSTELECYLSIAADFSEKVGQTSVGRIYGVQVILPAGREVGWAELWRSLTTLSATVHSTLSGVVFMYIASEADSGHADLFIFHDNEEIWKYLRDWCLLSPEPVINVSVARFFSSGAVIENPIDFSAYSFLGHPALRIPPIFNDPGTTAPYHFLLL